MYKRQVLYVIVCDCKKERTTCAIPARSNMHAILGNRGPSRRPAELLTMHHPAFVLDLHTLIMSCAVPTFCPKNLEVMWLHMLACYYLSFLCPSPTFPLHPSFAAWEGRHAALLFMQYHRSEAHLFPYLVLPNLSSMIAQTWNSCVAACRILLDGQLSSVH
jgi:hypothetical protein